MCPGYPEAKMVLVEQRPGTWHSRIWRVGSVFLEPERPRPNAKGLRDRGDPGVVDKHPRCPSIAWVMWECLSPKALPPWSCTLTLICAGP
jgi:hypothetical protein